MRSSTDYTNGTHKIIDWVLVVLYHFNSRQADKTSFRSENRPKQKTKTETHTSSNQTSERTANRLTRSSTDHTNGTHEVVNRVLAVLYHFNSRQAEKPTIFVLKTEKRPKPKTENRNTQQQ